ncbi:MAG: cation diffusion facilitator family transporter [Alistipes sp.]|jgi:cobalt-zinc-cadmium efflux system protein|nr:cation diffusion facilitator family transporter [Alistipes sp.]
MSHSHSHSHSGHTHSHSHGGHTHGGHSHSGHSHGSHTHEPATGSIATAFFLNLGFAVVELVGGVFTNSVAILSDALHDAGDSVSLGVAWALQKRAGRGRDAKFSYGYKRFSLLGSVFLSGILLVSSIFIVTEAIGRLSDPQPVRAVGMLWLAVGGIVVNGAAALRLKRGSSLNERAAFIHIMEDVLGWAAVLVVSVVLIFVEHPATRFLDPVISLVITLWVLCNVWRNLRDTFRILLQAVPEELDTARLTAEILALEGVESIHDLHVWSQDGESHVMTLHIVTPEGFSPADIQRVKLAVRDIGRRHNTDHVTVEFETTVDTDCEYSKDDR